MSDLRKRPEDSLLAAETAAIVEQVLGTISPREKDILQERMGKTWRRERYESDENSSRSFAKNQKRQWIDLEIMEEAAEFERDLFDQLGSKE